jgi:hypothetical protein
MRGHELLGLPVVDPSGRELGRVLDVRLVQDGPLLGAFAALRVEGLVVGTRRATSRLGYDRYDAHGPWLVRVLVHRLLRGTGYLRWSELELADGVVHSSLTELPSVPAIA